MQYKKKNKPALSRLKKIKKNRSLSNKGKTDFLDTESEQNKGNFTSRNAMKNVRLAHSQVPNSFGLPPIRRASVIE